MQKSIHRITITGVHKLDIVLYVSDILRCLGYRILICDRTRDKETAGCICRPDRSMELVRYMDMDFAYSELAALDEVYDYIFYLQDYNCPSQNPGRWSIYVCDGMNRHLLQLKQEMGKRYQGEQKQNAIIVFRNMYHCVAKEKFIEYQKKQQLDMKVYFCMHECIDEAAYQQLQFERFTGMGAISGRMEKVLRQLLCEVTQLEEQEVRKGIKMAKRGRYVDCCI